MGYFFDLVQHVMKSHGSIQLAIPLCLLLQWQSKHTTNYLWDNNVYVGGNKNNSYWRWLLNVIKLSAAKLKWNCWHVCSHTIIRVHSFKHTEKNSASETPLKFSVIHQLCNECFVYWLLSAFPTMCLQQSHRTGSCCTSSPLPTYDFISKLLGYSAKSENFSIQNNLQHWN